MNRSPVEVDVDDDGLRLELQPVVNLRTGAARTFEALVRWDVGGRRLAPAEFLPALSAQDVDRLFQRVLGRVLGHVRSWDLEGITVDVSVNVDPRTLRDRRCSSWVATALERQALSADRLVVEVLETSPVDCAAQTETLVQLRRLGVRVGMDDFGAGHSTIARLTDLPFDVVKIDRSLVGLLLSDPRSAASTIDSLVSAATSQRCRIVAEGVESTSLAEAVLLLGADLGQGFLYACPMPPEAVADWIRGRWAPRPQKPVTTMLGAFALHWRHASLGRVHPGGVEDCAMSTVLRDGADDAAVRWHARQHGDRPDPVAARALEEWLVSRVVGD